MIKAYLSCSARKSFVLKWLYDEGYHYITYVNCSSKWQFEMLKWAENIVNGVILFALWLQAEVICVFNELKRLST
jgi:hypothetical protein